MKKPTDGVLTFPYGATSAPYSTANPHAGSDYGAVRGGNVYAPHAGKVTLAGDLGNCGLAIDIDSGSRFKSRLCHSGELLVKVGDQVTEGQVVARAGDTGQAYGVHSHWVLWDTGVRVNGNNYLTGAPPLQPFQREVGKNGVNYRKAPSTSAEIIKEFLPGEILDFKGYVKGGTYNGNNIWFVGKYTSGYCWSGAFTDTSTHDLPDLTEPAQPAPSEPFVPRDPEMVNVTATDFPAWVNYEVAIDPDDNPNVNKEAYEFYKTKYGQDYQYYPIEAHLHWWGSPDAGYTHDGIVNYMIEKTDLSVDFVTSANRITHFGSLAQVHYTTGQRNMYAWKSENDPQLTEDGYKTMGLLVYVVEKKNPRLKDEQLRLHKEFQSTSCSNIDVDKVRAYADKFASGELDFYTGQPKLEPEPKEPTVNNPKSVIIAFLSGIAALIAAILALLKEGI